MQRYSTSLITRQTQIKTTMRYHLTHARARTAIIKKAKNNKCWQECGKKGTLMEKEMATHSSVLAWRIPGTVEPDGLPSMGLHRVGHDWSDWAAAAAVTQTHCLCSSTGLPPWDSGGKWAEGAWSRGSRWQWTVSSCPWAGAFCRSHTPAKLISWEALLRVSVPGSSRCSRRVWWINCWTLQSPQVAVFPFSLCL